MKKKTFIPPKVQIIPVPREGILTGSQSNAEDNNQRYLQIEEESTKSNIWGD